jgi:hypothetical protein
MYFKNITLVTLFIANLLIANLEPCDCSLSSTQPIFNSGWNTIEAETSKGYKMILRNHFNLKVENDFEIASIRKRATAFYEYGWLYELVVLDNEIQQSVYLLNTNMESVLLNDQKELKKFIKKNPPNLNTDMAVLEFLVIKTWNSSDDKLKPKVILSADEFLNDGGSTNLFISGPRVVHKEKEISLVQSFITVNDMVFSAIYIVSHNGQRIEMKDSFKVKDIIKEKGCSASYIKNGVPYINLTINTKPKVVLYQN